MAKRGGGRHRKRLNAPKIAVLKNRKTDIYLATTSPGPHSSKAAVPLVVVLRDMLQKVGTFAEAKRIVNEGLVFIDGRVAKDVRLPVGFGDIVSFKNINDKYLAVYSGQGRMLFKPLGKDEGKEKIGKVVNKFLMPKGKIRITLHDGKTLDADNDVNIGYSVKVAVPENKITGVIKLEPGVTCFIMKGKHIGNIGQLENITAGTAAGGHAVAKIKTKDNVEIATRKDYIIAVDDEWVTVVSR